MSESVFVVCLFICLFAFITVPVARSAKAASVAKLCSRFQFLGKFLARAIMDFRVLDIPFSQMLYKWLLNQEGTLDLGDMVHVDPILAQSLMQLQQVVNREKQLELDSSHTTDSRQLAVDSLTLDGTPIEDLGLSFALPGYPDIELKVFAAPLPIKVLISFVTTVPLEVAIGVGDAQSRIISRKVLFRRFLISFVMSVPL